MIKCFFDIVFAFLGLIITIPLFLIIVLAIKLSSPGPVFYRGERIGKNGKPFRIFKFRTMILDAEKLGGPSAADDDPRITKIGKVLRKCKLDEMPQFINVLKGEMSFVGPRPEVQQYVDMYSKEEQAILTVRPGMTDWATLWNSDEGAVLAAGQDSERTYAEKIRPKKIHLQLKYIKKRSFWVDIKIIFRTLVTVIFKKKPRAAEIFETKRLNVHEEMDFTYDMLDNLSNTYGESFYLLDTARFEKNYDEFIKVFRDIYPKSFIAYSYKTNYIPKLCLLVNRKGGYAEVVSEMEFDLAIKLGVSSQKIIYNGPYKSERSVKKCLVGGGIVNLDSIPEVDVIEKVAREHSEINMSVGIRCNFDIGSSVVSRFGFDVDGDEFHHVFKRLSKINNVSIKGLHCHFPDRCLKTFVPRIDKMLHLSKDLFQDPPEFINVGGGYFGKMDTSLKNQFNCKVLNYQEYADVIATKMQNIYGNLDDSVKPKLLLEPGTALVANTMKFVVKVISVKVVRNKYIATVSGSRFNILTTSNNINLPIKVHHCYEKDDRNNERYLIDIAGYTCIENDYLYREYKGYLAVGDYIVFDNVGSYSVVMKPPFILPNCAVIEYDPKNKTYNIVKRKEELEDIFDTFLE